MLIYEGLFTKSNGDLRSMRFARIPDIPKNLLEEVTKGSNSRNVVGNKELVWDIDHKAFKWFNHGTIVGNLTATEHPDYIGFFE